MIIDQNNLKNGYKTLSNYEDFSGFYVGLLHLIFSSVESTDNIAANKVFIKLCSSSFLVFLKKNCSDENYLSFNEKMVIFILYKYKL